MHCCLLDAQGAGQRPVGHAALPEIGIQLRFRGSGHLASFARASAVEVLDDGLLDLARPGYKAGCAQANRAVDRRKSAPNVSFQEIASPSG